MVAVSKRRYRTFASLPVGACFVTGGKDTAHLEHLRAARVRRVLLKLSEFTYSDSNGGPICSIADAPAGTEAQILSRNMMSNSAVILTRGPR